MPINSTHPTYNKRIMQWNRIRDFYDGEDAVKSKGELYLPRLSGQKDAEYKSYKLRALFFSIIAKSVSAMVGLATARPADFTGEDDVISQIRDVSNVHNELLNQLIQEMSTISRCGVLVDFSQTAAANEWPTPSVYPAESILNWGFINGQPFIVLQEGRMKPDQNDPYSQKVETIYRELTMAPVTNRAGIEEMVYVQKVYNEKLELEDTIIPQYRGKYIYEIPFVPLSLFGLSFDDCKPVMLDVANVNQSHYLSGADLEHARHFTGLPTPVILNAESNDPIYLGSSEAIVIPGKNADAKFLEFTGQGLQSLENALKEKERQMISLSAKALQESSNGSESTEAIMLRFSSESASLSTLVNVVEAALNRIYGWMCMFMLRDPVSVQLHKEFMSKKLDPVSALKWFELYTAGAISKDTLVHNYRLGQVYSDDYDLSMALQDVADRQSNQET